MVSTLVIADRVRTAQGIAGDAVLIENGAVRTIGWARDLRAPGQIEERFTGSTIIPGLGDAHFHPSGYTAALTRLNLAGSRDLAELLDRIREAGQAVAAGQPIVGIRLDDQHLAERRLPTRLDIDKAETDRPVLLFRYCGHVAVANTAALNSAGVTPDTDDPPGGVLDLDDSGHPTGVLRETAIDLVSSRINQRATGLETDTMLAALRGLVRQGLTRIGAIIKVGNPLLGGLGDDLELLTSIGRDLPLEVGVFVIADTPAELERAADRLNNAGRRLRFLGMKDFADGSFGGHTAAMRDGYHDQPDNRGMLRFDEASIGPVARSSLELGGRIAIHAIGDRANGRVLDFFELLRSEGADPDKLRIEHASVLTDDDLGRMAEVGATASVQPAFLTSEHDWLESQLGPLTESTYAFRSMVEAGIPLAGGSDCPVESPDPLWGMAAARDRHGLVTSEALTGAEALAMFTDGVAHAMGAPPPLSPGSPAHLTVLSRDPVEASPSQLRDAQVVSTWIDGEPQPFDPDALIWQ